MLSDLQMKDFVVEGEVKIPLDYEGFNSGLGFRLVGIRASPRLPMRNRPKETRGDLWYRIGGWIYPRKGTEAEYSNRVQGLFDANSWNHFRIRCIGPKAKTFLNGKLVGNRQLVQTREFWNPTPRQGWLGSISKATSPRPLNFLAPLFLTLNGIFERILP